jgi:hypothetical protein
MPVQEKSIKSVDSIFIATLGISLFLHALLLVGVMTVEMPPPPSIEEYSDWVKRIAPVREATVEPPPAVQEDLVPDDGDKVKADKVADGAGKASAGATKRGGAPQAGGGGGGGAKAGREGLRKSLGNAGVLGVIGVASEGGDGEFADVFSSESGGVSDDLGSVMEGKRGAVVASAGSNIGRKNLGGSGEGGIGGGGGKGQGGVGTLADIGAVGVKAGGSVSGGARKDVDVPSAQVAGGDADVLSGDIDRRSASSAISKKSSGFRRCYERGLKGNPNLRGKLAFELTIDANGKVVEARFIEDSVKSKDVLECIKGILLRMSFAKPSGGLASFRSSLVFEAQK